MAPTLRPLSKIATGVIFFFRRQTAQTGAAKSFYAGSMDKGLQDLLLSGSL
jgi:hypothetical protein